VPLPDVSHLLCYHKTLELGLKLKVGWRGNSPGNEDRSDNHLDFLNLENVRI
jgi:hypothetical protein